MCRCNNVTVAGLKLLRKLPLTRLELSGVNWLTDEVLEFLRCFPLTDLDIGASDGFSDEGLRFVADLPLTKLTLSGSGEDDGHLITDAGLLHLRGLTNLKCLDLWFQIDITDAGT